MIEGQLPPNLEVWLDVSLPEGRCIGVVAAGRMVDCFPVDDDTDTSSGDDDVVVGALNNGGNNGGDDGGDDDNENEARWVAAKDPATVEDDHRHHRWMRHAFHPAEVRYGMTLKKSRASFWLGRLALRLALDFPDYPILKDSYGRPQLSPSGVFGSISHKQDRGIALVSPVTTIPEDMDGEGDGRRRCVKRKKKRLAGVGIDLELTSRPGRPSVASRILTEGERNALGSLPGINEEEEVLLRFRWDFVHGNAFLLHRPLGPLVLDSHWRCNFCTHTFSCPA
jgi:4'-phosphopantetheinyl transferase EntD